MMHGRIFLRKIQLLYRTRNIKARANRVFFRLTLTSAKARNKRGRPPLVDTDTDMDRETSMDPFKYSEVGNSDIGKIMCDIISDAGSDIRLGRFLSYIGLSALVLTYEVHFIIWEE
jgi:hypothetical protein